MKNKRKLAVISLVVMMMITAVGYAAFSDSLTVLGTAQSATFNVEFVKNKTSADEGVTVDLVAPEGELAFQSPSDLITIHVKDALPGKVYRATVQIINRGSVNAKYGSFSLKGIPELFDVTPIPAAVIAPNETKTFGIDFQLKSSIPDYKEGVLIPLTEAFVATIVYTQE